MSIVFYLTWACISSTIQGRCISISPKEFGDKVSLLGLGLLVLLGILLVYLVESLLGCFCPTNRVIGGKKEVIIWSLLLYCTVNKTKNYKHVVCRSSTTKYSPKTYGMISSMAHVFSTIQGQCIFVSPKEADNKSLSHGSSSLGPTRALTNVPSGESFSASYGGWWVILVYI
eukprot:Gb_29146 [translate_table: standard]